MSTIKIDLLPKDFKGWKTDDDSHNTGLYVDNHNCPLAKAIKRHFNTQDVQVGASWAHIGNDKYDIKDQFGIEDARMVWEKYQKDPKAEKVIYQVTLN